MLIIIIVTIIALMIKTTMIISENNNSIKSLSWIQHNNLKAYTTLSFHSLTVV